MSVGVTLCSVLYDSIIIIAYSWFLYSGLEYFIAYYMYLYKHKNRPKFSRLVVTFSFILTNIVMCIGILCTGFKEDLGDFRAFYLGLSFVLLIANIVNNVFLIMNNEKKKDVYYYNDIESTPKQDRIDYWCSLIIFIIVELSEIAIGL